MKVTLWGTRGSLAAPGPETARYGGNTSCVGVLGCDDTLLVLDAGTGIRRLSWAIPPNARRVDILLTHLHMDHIQGLGFFAPLYNPMIETHIWGPASTTQDLRTRLTRYLSPPLFPVHLRDLPRTLLHEVPCGTFQIGDFTVDADFVCHPGPTVGYRITACGHVLTYLPDHEPALATSDLSASKEWTSGLALADGADLLIHDAQYSTPEYEEHIGWGHSSLQQALAFAKLAEVRHLVPFHHDPLHHDDELDTFMSSTLDDANLPFTVTPAIEGASFELGC